MNGRVAHLVRRFAGAVVARAPSAHDEAWVDQQLLPGERHVWVRMNDSDRAHSLAVARRFCAAVPEAPRAAIAAALLHDVGKVEVGLGTWGRVAATLVGPRGDRFRRYHDHEAIGAFMLRQAGSDRLTIALVEAGGDAPADLVRALRAADSA